MSGAPRVGRSVRGLVGGDDAQTLDAREELCGSSIEFGFKEALSMYCSTGGWFVGVWLHEVRGLKLCPQSDEFWIGTQWFRSPRFIDNFQ